MYTFKKTQLKMRQDLGGLQVAIIPGEFVNPPPKLLDLSLGRIPEPKPGEESALSEELSRLGLKEEDSIQNEMELLRKMKINDLYQVRGRVAKYKQELKEYEFKTVQLDPTPKRIPKRKLDSGLANLSLDESKLSKQGIREESSMENTLMMMQRRNLQDIAKVHQLQDRYQSEMAKLKLGVVRVAPPPPKPVNIDFSQSNPESAAGKDLPNEESTLQSQLLMKQLGAKDKFQMRLQQTQYQEMLLANQVYFIQDHLVSQKVKDLSPLDEEDTLVSQAGKQKTPADDMKKVGVNKELEKFGIHKYDSQDPDQSWSVANFVEFHNYKRQLRIWKNREEDLMRKNEREQLQQQNMRTSRSLDISHLGNDVSYGAAGRPFTKPQRFVPNTDNSRLQKSRMRLSTPQANGLAPMIPLDANQGGQPLANQAKKPDISQEGYFKIVSAPPNESFEYNDYREAIDPRKKPVSAAAASNLRTTAPVANTAIPKTTIAAADKQTMQQMPSSTDAKSKGRNMWPLHEEFDGKRKQVVDQVRQKKIRDENGNKLYRDTPLQRIVVNIRRLNRGEGDDSGLSVIEEGPGNDEVEDLDLLAGTQDMKKQPRIKKQNGAPFKSGDTATSKIFGEGFDESSIGMGLIGNPRQDEEGRSFLQDSMFIDLLGDNPATKPKPPIIPAPNPKNSKPMKEPPAPKLNKLNKPAYDHFEADMVLPGKMQREVDFIPEPVIKVSSTKCTKYVWIPWANIILGYRIKLTHASQSKIPLTKSKPKTDEPSNNPVLFGSSPNTSTNALGRQDFGIELGAAGTGDWTPKPALKVKRPADEYQPSTYAQQPSTRPNIYVKGKIGQKHKDDSAADDRESLQMPHGPDLQEGDFDLREEIRRNALGEM